MFLTQSRLAVSIEGTSIRLLACRARTVQWWAEVSLEPRLFRNGFLIDARGFVQALKSSNHAGKIPKGNVVAALPGFQSFSRVLRVPKEARRNLAAIVAGDARRSFPDVERNMFLYWQAFGAKDDMQQSVFLLAVPKQPLTTYLDALGAAGMRPRTLDLRPLALARSVNRPDAIIGNSESTVLDVIIVRNDVPVVMRSMYLGEDYEAPEYVNARLAEELARTVAHFNSTSQEGHLAPDTPVLLTGRGVAMDPTLGSSVEEMTQHPVVALEPPFDYPDDFPVGQFMVHLGLMLK